MEPSDEELLARYGRHPAPPAEGEVVEGPTDEELWDIGERHLWTGTDESVTNYRILTSFIEAARVVLARYGHQPAPPAEGEVAELTRWLRMQGEAQKPGPNSLLSDRTKKEHHAAGVKLTRAAALLEQRYPAPVPVSERLPGPEDCDAERNCWQWIPDISGHYPLGHWELQHRDWVSDPDGDATHWLPSTALPLPAAEVKP